jgi:hypothetical protein
MTDDGDQQKDQDHPAQEVVKVQKAVVHEGEFGRKVNNLGVGCQVSGIKL